MKRKLLPWLLLPVLFLGLQQYASRGLITGTAPPALGRTLQGKPADPSGGEGKSAIVYFWASWCPVCKIMQGTVNALAKDVPIVSVAMLSGDAAEVRRYAEQMQLTAPVVVDAEGRIAESYGVRGVPAVFIVGPDGKIRFASVGFSSEWGIRARLWLVKWL